MKKWLYLLVNISLFTTSLATAQSTREPFTAIWNFNNSTPTGASSVTSVVASNLTPFPNTNRVQIPTLASVAYPNSPPPGSGKHINIQTWSANAACDGNEYVEVTVSPQGGKDFTVTSISFLVSSSGTGPRSLVVTSSVTGFNVGQPLITTGLTQSDTPFSWQLIDIPLSSLPGYKNVTSPITFRIVACQASATTGTLRLDNININGDIMLPADLVAFTARADGRQVRLDWATSWERNTDRFVAEASTDLLQFRRVGEVASAGTTDQRQFYSLTDETPAPGPNYYRLLQIDRDGAVHYSRIISAIVQTSEPAIHITPNPADRQQISLTLLSTDSAELMVFDALGRSVAGRLVIQSGTDAIFIPDFPLAAGRYWLRLTTPGVNTGVAVLVP